VVSAEVIEAWAADYGLEPCIGHLFVSEHGGRLPYDLDELCSWANSTGRRSPNGVWSCTALTQSSDWYGKASTWVRTNPGSAAVLAVLVFSMLKSSSRRYYRRR
jgi:hypothetical protein